MKRYRGNLIICETRTKGLRDNRFPFAYGHPYREGIKVVKANCMWVEHSSKDADYHFGVAKYMRYCQCCICDWSGVFMNEIVLEGVHYYIPICRKCQNFMWPARLPGRPCAKILYNGIETKRRRH